MINKEILQVIAMGSGGILGAIGGMGPKYVRRFILPLILGVLAMLAGFPVLKYLLMASGFVIAFCLPYGERTPYWRKFIVGCAFVVPTLILGFSWWQVITPIIFIIMFKISNTKWGQSTIFWKAWEFIVFSCVGITVASLIK